MASNSNKANTPLELKNTKTWLEDLETEQDRLSSWEKDFVSDLQQWFYDKGSLTTAQYNKLAELYEKRF